VYLFGTIRCLLAEEPPVAFFYVPLGDRGYLPIIP
jgi:hypothetical protein